MSFSIEAILKPSFGVKSSRNIDLNNTQPMDMRKYRNEDDKVDYKTARIQGEYSSGASPTTSTSSVSATSSRSNSPVSDCTISRDNIVNNDLNEKYETCSDSKHDQPVYTEDEFEALESNSFSNHFNRIYNFDTKFLHRNLYQNFQTMKQFLYPDSALSNLYFGEKFPSTDIQPDPRIFPIYHNSMDAFHSMKTLPTREVNNGRTSDLYTIIHSTISAQLSTSVCSDKKFSSSDNNFSHKTFNDTSKICSHKKFCSTSNECSDKNSCGTHSFQNKSSCSAGSTHPDDISCTILDKKLRSTHSTSSDRHIVKTANTCPGKTFLSANTTCSNNTTYNCSEKKFIIPGYPSPDKKLSSRDNSCSYKKIKNVTLGRNKCSTNIKQGNQSSNDVGKEIKEEKRHKDPFVWPAWVYCTRYSDRPSSGPRYRKPRARSYNDDDKRPRTAFSTQQLHRLRREFESCPYLSETRRQNLAVDLGLNESQVKIWFQNKRAKLKKSSGNKNTLAMRLMQEGLYNHSTIVVDDAHDDSDKSKNNIVG